MEVAQSVSRVQIHSNALRWRAKVSVVQVEVSDLSFLTTQVYSEFRFLNYWVFIECSILTLITESVCSESGGRSKDPLRSTPYDAGMRFDQLTGEQANYAMGISTRWKDSWTAISQTDKGYKVLSRYYYNPIDGQCHPFTYNGFLGNFNNFHTQSDCQIFCARCKWKRFSLLLTLPIWIQWAPVEPALSCIVQWLSCDAAVGIVL